MNKQKEMYHMTKLLKDITDHVEKDEHAVVLLSDYLILKGLYENNEDFSEEKKQIQNLEETIKIKIISSEDWELMKETLVPTFEVSQQEIIKKYLF